MARKVDLPREPLNMAQDPFSWREPQSSRRVLELKTGETRGGETVKGQGGCVEESEEQT